MIKLYRRTSRMSARTRVIGAFLVLLLALSCGGKGVLDKANEEYEKGRYREAIFVIRHHFRRGGGRHPELLFLAGKAYLELGSEAEAEDAFAEAFSKDSTLTGEISAYLKDEAEKSLSSGLTLKGKRFMRQALTYDREIDFNGYNAMAGDIMMDRRDYVSAARYFERYLEGYPDSSGAAEVMLSLGTAYEEIGETESAIENYRRFQERYPLSRLKTTVMWKLENLLFRMAEETLAEGKYDEARYALEDLASGASARLVRERANFLLGEIAEQTGDKEAALRYYREVVHLGLGESGRLLEKAKERIEELELAKKRQ
jgi:tetratricopeptide (TPR) repeat protein